MNEQCGGCGGEFSSRKGLDMKPFVTKINWELGGAFRYKDE